MDIDNIKAASDIVDVIGSYLSLKRDGKNYSALCPFHGEKTPSFKVFPDTQRYKCFGCGEAGDVLTFVVKVERIDFKQAAIMLAERAGIVVEDEKDSRALYYELYEKAVQVYRETLAYDDKAQAYLEGRQVQDSLFEIGYADGWTTIAEAMPNRATDLCTVGLCRKSERGRLYDVFRDRIMFPIRDVMGRPVGFGARTITDKMPKYLNSAESPVFDKGSCLYGLHLAKAAMATQGAVIMEGYLDVISAHRMGIANAVATLGTALSAAHIRVLARFTQKIVMVYDGDKAGIAATEKAVPLMLDAGVQAHVVILPDKQDPHDYLLAHGADAFRSMLNSSPEAFRFVVERIKANDDLSDPMKRFVACKRLMGILTLVKDKVQQEIYTAEAAAIVGLSPEMLRLSSKMAPTEQYVLPEAASIAAICLEYPHLAELYPNIVSEQDPDAVSLARKRVVSERLAHDKLRRYVAKKRHQEIQASITKLKTLIAEGIESDDEWAVDCLMNELINALAKQKKH